MSLDELHIDSDSFQGLHHKVKDCLGILGKINLFRHVGQTKDGLTYCKLNRYYSTLSVPDVHCPYMTGIIEVNPDGQPRIAKHYYGCLFKQWKEKHNYEH